MNEVLICFQNKYIFSVLISLWEISDIKSIFELTVLELVEESIDLLTELGSSLGVSQLLSGLFNLSGLWGVEGSLFSSVSDVPLFLDGPEGMLEIFLFLLNRSQSSVINVDGWEWTLRELNFFVEGLNNINEFILGLLSHLVELLILQISINHSWRLLKSLGLGDKILELTGSVETVDVGTEEVSLTFKPFGSLWLDRDGDKVFGRDDSKEECDGSRFEHLVYYIFI